MARMVGIGLAAQTMFAELLQQAMDAEFDKEHYDERGSFVRKRIDGALYWYYQRRVDGKVKQSYVGPVKDVAISSRVERFGEIKSDYKRRREMVRALTAIGLGRPDEVTGQVTEALWKAGFFRLRGVLVGTAAFQCYSGLIGAKLSAVSLMTQDLDAAQFYDVSHAVGDSMPPILDVLRSVDKTFAPIPHLTEPVKVARFRAKSSGFLVEFLTPNRGSDRNTGRLSKMPALGGASAIPLRFLDYLIYQPVRSVALYKGGIPVTVPSPYRYAVHKLIVATQRENLAKVGKDLLQAAAIINAVLPRHSEDLREAWENAWERGPAWRKALKAGATMLDDDARRALATATDA
jgi:hypothetical protein